MRIVGIIPVYNESDIIASVIDHLLSQRIELVILDGGSSDGSHEIESQYVGMGVLALETLKTEGFELGLILETLYEMALRHNPDWVLMCSADEFLESPYPRQTLKAAIEMEDQKGYNLIQANNFEFFPTERDGENLGIDVRSRMKYYTWNDDAHFPCWKVSEGITLPEGGNHYPVFPNTLKTKISPTKYVLRHYRFRSYEHGLKKVFGERLPRYPEYERKKGWHVHYDKFGMDESYFIIDSRNLNKYLDDGKWIVKKTFDWTWGLQARPWANPPVKRALSTRIAERFPFVARLWKTLFLRKYPRSVAKE